MADRGWYHVMGGRGPRTLPSRQRAQRFLHGLAEAASALELHAYCLMGSHYHLLLRARGEDLSEPLGRLEQEGGPASRRIGLTAHRHVVHVSRYIHLNPVAAGLARSPQLWPHSSYRAYLDFRCAPPWLQTRTILGFFGSIGPRHAYRRFVEAGLDPGGDDFFGRPKLRSLLGDDPPQGATRVPLGAIAREVARAFEASALRGSRDPLARGAFVHAARRLGGWRLREIAAWLGYRGSDAMLRAALRFEAAVAADPSLLARLARIVAGFEEGGVPSLVYTPPPRRRAMQRESRHDLRAIARRAMAERGLVPGFSPEVVAEAERIDAGARDDDASVRDLRELEWVSIDNDDSRDLDQLSHAEPAGAGATRIRVAIADVDALVPEGSAIDGRARHNTTAIYTAAETFPMLPIRLCHDLTSLVESEDRRAVVVEMVVEQGGEISGSDVYRAWVRNHAKLAYRGVAAWLEGGAALPRGSRGVEEQLRIQDRVAQALRGVRHRQGALNLETIEPRAVLVAGTLADLVVDEKNRAKELIEDLMIAANGITARFLESAGRSSLRRVLRSPERWERIVELAASLGATLPGQPDAEALEGFLLARRRADPKRFPDLSLTVVKLMGRGEYEVERPGYRAPGHFGLAVEDYTHSTAPNRRFPDLVTQRLLKAALAGRASPYGDDELDALAEHCTRQEDNANKVERLVRKAAAALLLESRIGERFGGIVTGASRKGTWVRIFHPPAEGRVVQGAAGLDVGEQVTVELVDTDVERGFIDFARVR